MAMAWSAGSAEAFDFPDVWDDPLLAAPPVLAAGAVLPGDDAPAACPPDVDLTQPLALGDAVDLALCHNPRIQAAWATIRIQAAALGEARSAWLPTLNGSASWLTTQTRYPQAPSLDTRGAGRTSYASLNWRLLDFGGRSANRTAAQRRLEAALASHDAAMQKALVAVIGAYFDVQRAQAADEARTESVRLAESTLAATRQRQARGVAARSDALQAETALANAMLTERRARGDVARTRATLVFAMGVPAEARLSVPAAAAPVSSNAMRELDAWLREAEAGHPEIKAARAQWEAAKAQVKATRSEGMPTLDLSGTFSQNGYPNQGLQSTRTTQRSIGLTLTIPFFEGFSRTYKIRGAQARAEQAQAQLHDAETQILGEVAKAHADTVAAVGNLDASARLLHAAEAALASARHRYSRGAADILELLSAQAVLADARQERVRTIAEWESARLRLLASAGSMGRWAAR